MTGFLYVAESSGSHPVSRHRMARPASASSRGKARSIRIKSVFNVYLCVAQRTHRFMIAGAHEYPHIACGQLPSPCDARLVRLIWFGKCGAAQAVAPDSSSACSKRATPLAAKEEHRSDIGSTAHHHDPTLAQASVVLKAWSMFRIREVDGHDDEIADTLADLHRLTFFGGASIPEFDRGHWWLAHHEAVPVAFAGLVPSTHAHNAGYFCRVGVLKKHCGHGLQLRLMRALESRARHNGWNAVVSDTTDNLASANNFIRAGYRLYQPQTPWAWGNTLYWRKFIR